MGSIFAEPRRSYTKAFGRYALELSRLMTIQDVAHHLGVSWDVIKEIVKEDLRHRFARPKLKHLRQLAIDEIKDARILMLATAGPNLRRLGRVIGTRQALA